MQSLWTRESLIRHLYPSLESQKKLWTTAKSKSPLTTGNASNSPESKCMHLRSCYFLNKRFRYMLWGGPGVVREPLSLGQKIDGKLDSREIHPALSRIAKPKDGKHFGKHSSLPFIDKHSGTQSIFFSIHCF